MTQDDDLDALFDHLSAEYAGQPSAATSVPATDAPATSVSKADTPLTTARAADAATGGPARAALAGNDPPAAGPSAPDSTTGNPAAGGPSGTQTHIAPPAAGGDCALYGHLGHLTRALHDALHELGFDKSIAQAADSMPDARDRLNYVANLTAQAAERALNAVDAAQPLQAALEQDGEALSGRWERLFEHQLDEGEFRALAHDTRSFLKTLPGKTQATRAQLMEILMAQDFQDLTGQVIKKIAEIAQDVEGQLLRLLLDASPEHRGQERPARREEGLLNGPVVNPAGRADVVADQAQVDDLLHSLGF